MPGKWGGTHRARPPRSANELGCQANGGAHAGHAPLDPPMTAVAVGGGSSSGVSARGGVYPSTHWAEGCVSLHALGRGVSAPVHAGIHPLPVDGILETRL